MMDDKGWTMDVIADGWRMTGDWWLMTYDDDDDDEDEDGDDDEVENGNDDEDDAGGGGSSGGRGVGGSVGGSSWWLCWCSADDVFGLPDGASNTRTHMCIYWNPAYKYIYYITY